MFSYIETIESSQIKYLSEKKDAFSHGAMPEETVN